MRHTTKFPNKFHSLIEVLCSLLTRYEVFDICNSLKVVENLTYAVQYIIVSIAVEKRINRCSFLCKRQALFINIIDRTISTIARIKTRIIVINVLRRYYQYYITQLLK